MTAVILLGDAAHTRAYGSRHAAAHLIAPGEKSALCGAVPRNGGAWLSDATRLTELPTCVRCTHRARFRAEVAAWDGPALRPGVVARVTGSQGKTYPAAECARCEKLRPIRYRGLCRWCVKAATEDGTISRYGWLKGDRLGEFGAYRAGGLTVPEASARCGVSDRTGWRYETALAEAGQATWRAAS